MRLNLTAKILLFMAAAATLALAVYLWLFSHFENQRLHSRVRQDAQIIANLVQDLSYSAGRYDPVYLQTLADSITKLSVVSSVEIFDSHSAVIAHSRHSRIGETPLPSHAPFVAKVLATGHDIHTVDDLTNQHLHFTALYAAGKNGAAGGIIGAVEIAMDMRREEQLAAELNHSFMKGTSAVIATLFVLLFLALKRFVLSPLRILTLASGRLGAGRFDQRVELSTHDEMGQLAGSFNRMTDSLRQSHAGLETRIRERTADLERTVGQLQLEIRERLHAEEALHAAKELAEAGSRSKSEFLAVISHELRTPLSTMLGMTELLLADRAMPQSQQREHLEMARRAGRDLLTLIDDLLDFSRIEVDRLALILAPFDVQTMIEEVVDRLEYKAMDKGIELFIEVADDLPPNCMGDAGRVRQVIGNLLDNAIKFTERGRVLLRVTAEPSARRQTVLRFSVTDTGIGIPEDQQQVIFDRFTQVDATHARRYGGTGLGLAICKRLVELMGGSIGVDSRPGHGATFWFTLPVVAAPQLQTATATEAAVQAAPERPAHGDPRERTVLLVEDNRLNQITLKSMLEQLGCRVDIAGTGREALDRLDKGYDVIFMDISMPEMDGYEATAELRRRETGGLRTPVIAMTAHAMTGDIERTRATGMDDYLGKPVGLEQLRGMLVRWCDSPAAQTASGRARSS